MFKKLIASIMLMGCIATPAFAELSVYPKGFPNGISIRGMSILNTYSGNVYWVGSGTANASNSNKGDTPERPFATITYVLSNKVTANNGDIIMVKPGHTEDMGNTSITMSTGGVAIVGLGVGSNRPTFTWGTNSTKIQVIGNNNTFKNLYFDMTGAGSVSTGIDIDANYTTLEDCEILQSDSSGQCNMAIDVGTSAATVINKLKVVANTASPQAAINISDTAAQLVVSDCWIDGNYGSATISNPSGAVATNLLIKDNFLRNQKSAVIALDLNSACTGILSGNVYHSNVGSSTGAVDPGSMFSYQNYSVSAVDKSAVLSPVSLD